jgi:cbb3-type cytochrome oxidase subunit 3
VGVNSATAISSGAGKSRDINLVTEIQTEGGFMTVTGQYALGADGVCCVLTNITVEKFESSPIRIVWETAAKIGKFVGLFFLGIVILTVLLVMRSNKKKRAAREAGLS